VVCLGALRGATSIVENHPFNAQLLSKTSGAMALNLSDLDEGSGSSRTRSSTTSQLPSSSTLAAFKELQTKARAVEQGRAEAFRQREELRRQLAESRRREALVRSKSESLGNESVLAVRSKGDVVKALQHELHVKEHTLNAEARVIGEEIGSRTARVCELEEAYADQHTQNMRLLRRGRELESELELEQKRLEVLSQRRMALTVSMAEARTRLLDEINNCKLETRQTQDAAARAQLRCNALGQYMTLILNVNADLVQSIEQQQSAKQHLDRFVVMPRYTWPKGIVNNALGLVATAATDTLHQNRLRTAKTRVSKDTIFLREEDGRVPRRKVRRPKKTSKNAFVPLSDAVDETGFSSADFLNVLVRTANRQFQRKPKRPRFPSTLPGYMRPKSF